MATILYACAHKYHSDIFGEALEQAGHDVVTANDGADALRVLEEQAVDLIVLGSSGELGNDGLRNRMANAPGYHNGHFSLDQVECILRKGAPVVYHHASRVPVGEVDGYLSLAADARIMKDSRPESLAEKVQEILAPTA